MSNKTRYYHGGKHVHSASPFVLMKIVTIYRKHAFITSSRLLARRSNISAVDAVYSLILFSLHFSNFHFFFYLVSKINTTFQKF